MKRRGLSGVELMASPEGLRVAIEHYFQGASKRFQVNYTRIFSGWSPKKSAEDKRRVLTTGLRAVFSAPTRELAVEMVGHLADSWRGSRPKVAEHIEEHIEKCPSCLFFPECYRRRVRTANGLERLNQGIKCRSREVRIFPNREAYPRLVTALVQEHLEEWIRAGCYLNMTELEESHTGEQEETRGWLL